MSLYHFIQPMFFNVSDVLWERRRYECGVQPAAVPREGVVCAMVPPRVVRLAQHEGRGHGVCLPVTMTTHTDLNINDHEQNIISFINTTIDSYALFNLILS